MLTVALCESQFEYELLHPMCAGQEQSRRYFQRLGEAELFDTATMRRTCAWCGTELMSPPRQPPLMKLPVHKTHTSPDDLPF